MPKPTCASHQTVGWLIEQLKTYPKNLPVVFATAQFSPPLYFFSDYLIDNGTVLCIDVGEDNV